MTSGQTHVRAYEKGRSDFTIEHLESVLGWAEGQHAGRASEGLIAGNKKDIVATTRMDTWPECVPIYGWHRDVGDPIQPPPLVHDDDSEDPSHGFRLVHPVADLNDEPVDLPLLVSSPTWGALLSGESGLDLDAHSLE